MISELPIFAENAPEATSYNTMIKNFWGGPPDPPSGCASKHNGRVTQQPGCADLSQPLIYINGSMLIDLRLVLTVSNWVLPCPPYMTSIHFCRESRDFAKTLASLMDLVGLHLLQYQQIPSLMSALFLSLIAIPHLVYVALD